MIRFFSDKLVEEKKSKEKEERNAERKFHQEQVSQFH